MLGVLTVLVLSFADVREVAPEAPHPTVSIDVHPLITTAAAVLGASGRATAIYLPFSATFGDSTTDNTCFQ